MPTTVSTSTPKSHAAPRDSYTAANVHPPRGVMFTYSTAADRAFRGAVLRGDYLDAPQALVAAAGAQGAWDAVLTAERDRSHEGVVARLVDDLLAGRPVDPYALDAALEAGERAQAVQRRLVALAGVVSGSLDDGWHTLAPSTAPQLITGLRARLDEVLAQGRAAATALGRLDTADPLAVAAATPEQARALLALSALTAEYDQVRHLQQLAIAVCADRPGDRSATMTVGRKAGWVEIFATGLAEFRRAPARGTLAPAKPGPEATARFFQVLGRDDVWCPTADEVIAVADVVTGSAAA